MNRVITILLLVVMLIQAFSKVFIVLDYQANKNYIAEFLCVNKNKPELHCEGHCYLKKELKKAEQAENQSASQNQKLKFDFTLYCQNLFNINLTPHSLEAAVHAPFLTAAATSRPTAIFHPPSFTVS